MMKVNKEVVFVAFFLACTLIGGGKCLSQEEAEICVDSHNKLRQLHANTGNLQWDPSLAARAQAFADHLMAINKIRPDPTDPILDHSNEPGVGENLHWKDNRIIGKCAHAGHSWYEEIKRYSYLTASSSNGKAIGHFSQLVWKGTTHFGVGIATMPSRRFAEYGNKETFIVAMYTPPGNLPGGYSTNVQPRKDGCQGVSCTVPTVEELDPTLVIVPTTTTTTTKDPLCNDKQDNCQLYFNAGHSCKGLYEHFFKENCFKSCNYC